MTERRRESAEITLGSIHVCKLFASFSTEGLFYGKVYPDFVVIVDQNKQPGNHVLLSFAEDEYKGYFGVSYQDSINDYRIVEFGYGRQRTGEGKSRVNIHTEDSPSRRTGIHTATAIVPSLIVLADTEGEVSIPVIVFDEEGVKIVGVESISKDEIASKLNHLAKETKARPTETFSRHYRINNIVTDYVKKDNYQEPKINRTQVLQSKLNSLSKKLREIGHNTGKNKGGKTTDNLRFLRSEIDKTKNQLAREKERHGFQSS